MIQLPPRSTLFPSPSYFFFFLMIRRPPISPLFPSTPLFRSEVSGPVESAVCPPPAGPPTCWCRPPLPGLPLAFARAYGIDPQRSLLLGTTPAHRTLEIGRAHV